MFLHAGWSSSSPSRWICLLDKNTDTNVQLHVIQKDGSNLSVDGNLTAGTSGNNADISQNRSGLKSKQQISERRETGHVTQGHLRKGEGFELQTEEKGSKTFRAKQWETKGREGDGATEQDLRLPGLLLISSGKRR